MKYELTDETHPTHPTVYRIRALRDIPERGVNSGDLGGWVESESNLSKSGTAWVSDVEPGPSKVLAHRFPHAPNIGDLCDADWTALPAVDIVTAGYPCQPFSRAGSRKGNTDERHLWPHIAAALRILRPRIVVLENVSTHLSLGLDDVLADLAEIGFDAEWGTMAASTVGAPHTRERLFVVAARGRVSVTNPDRERQQEQRGTVAAPTIHNRPERVGGNPWAVYAPAVHRWEGVLGRPAPEPTTPRRDGSRVLSARFAEWMMGLPDGWVTAVPGVSHPQQLRALGNGVVPLQAHAAVVQLGKRFA